MTKCYFCGANEISVPNQKWPVKGKRCGMRKQKTIRICSCCCAWMSNEEISERVTEDFDWD